MPETETKTKHKKSNFTPIYLSDEDDTIDLLELLKILWKKRYLIIVFTIVAFFGSFSYLFLQPLDYKTETIIVPLENKDFQVPNEQVTQILKEVNDDNKQSFLIDILDTLRKGDLEGLTKRIKAEKQKALNEIKNTVVDIALQASEKVIKRNLNNEDNKKLVEQTVDEFKQAN